MMEVPTDISIDMIGFGCSLLYLPVLILSPRKTRTQYIVDWDINVSA